MPRAQIGKMRSEKNDNNSIWRNCTQTQAQMTLPFWRTVFLLSVHSKGIKRNINVNFSILHIFAMKICESEKWESERVETFLCAPWSLRAMNEIPQHHRNGAQTHYTVHRKWVYSASALTLNNIRNINKRVGIGGALASRHTRTLFASIASEGVHVKFSST